MKTGTAEGNFYFLQGGGEIGRLIRAKDWSKTSLGNPKTWPQSLKTTLSILLNSNFPMFLFWGPELICFYNDAYHLSLGNDGKLPGILGESGETTRTELWSVIKPLANRVLSKGEAACEDQQIKIYRNGKTDDVYWNFSYSPVIDESGKPAGVFVTCSETAEKIITLQKPEEIDQSPAHTKAQIKAVASFSEDGTLREWIGAGTNIPEQRIAEKTLKKSEQNLRSIISQVPVAMCILKGKEYVVEIANEKMFELWGKPAEELVNKPIFEGLYEAGAQGIEPLLEKVFTTGETCRQIERPVNLPRNGKIETVYVNFVFDPFYEAEGEISGIVAVAIEVTEQVLARKKIEESEKEYRQLADSLPELVWTTDKNGKQTFASKRWKEFTGLEPYDENTFTAIVHPDDLENITKIWTAALASGKIYTTEVRIKNKSGTYEWFYVNGEAVKNENGDIEKWTGAFTNINERKKAEESLKLTSERFRVLADSMPQFVWTADAEGNLNYFNKAVFDYSGLSLHEIENGGWLQIVHPEERDENVRLWLNSIATGNDFIFQHRFRKYNGEYRWQLSRAVSQKDEFGTIHLWIGTSTDIQEQVMFSQELEKKVDERTRELKEMNEALKSSEDRYHLMVGEVQDYAILYLNRNGIIENWNKGAEKIKGYKAEEIIGKNFCIFYGEKDRQSHLPDKLLEKAIANGRATHEGWRVRKDGSTFWGYVVITALRNEKHEVIGFSKVTRDLTEKKRAEDKIKSNNEKLEQKNRELKKMNAELESFAYVASHDLQEPLRKIQTFATRIIAKELKNLSEEGKEYFRRMQNAAQRMQTLIEDLLSYSRTNTEERKFVNTDLNKIVDEIKEDFKEELLQKHATIDATEMCNANIIPFQFHQLMHNLVGNALKFSKQEEEPRIQIKSKVEKNIFFENENIFPSKKYCHITVTDNGIGFEPEYSEKIFEVFQRLHGKEQYKGTGIGLAIVKKIVENHNGIITASGKLNEGATFDIFIPAN